MIDLASAIERLDPGDMLGALRAFPDHFREGWVLAADLQPTHRPHELDAVVVLGMGGSAIGGDLVRCFVRPSAPVPLIVVRDYELPAWVGPRTLAIASSYSGETEETLAAFAEALDRTAAVYVVASGGRLLEEARARDLPHVAIPGGMQPRAALGYSFGALLRIAEKLGLTDVPESAFEQAVAAARRAAEAFADLGGNAALDLAETLHNRLPIVYTGPGLLEAVGLRWRNQIHENAKQPAYGNTFAELNHNEIMGWEAAARSLRQQVAVVVLRDAAEHPRIARRMEVTRDLLADRLGSWTELTAEGEEPLERLLTTLQLGDFTSYYLALLAGQDPTPVQTIQNLKATLAA